MTTRLARTIPAIVISLIAVTNTTVGRGEMFRVMSVQEATIADIRAALIRKELTCRQLVESYIDHIEAYDRKGPALNAIIMINPSALPTADALDQELDRSGSLRPLHCAPVIVKDNYDTTDMPTSAGSLSLKGSTTSTDAFIVRKLRDAGALLLAKSNMAEFAWSPFETVGSLLPGYTRNPYAVDRVPAGSSGGTAAAVAANFGAVGLGTDTGNSIRGPSSHTSLAGIRSTMGLTSRDGIVPLFLSRDIGGPMARTMADAVAVFDVIADYDPADPATAAGQGQAAGQLSQISGSRRAQGESRRGIAAIVHGPRYRSGNSEGSGAGARRHEAAGCGDHRRGEDSRNRRDSGRQILLQPLQARHQRLSREAHPVAASEKP